MKTPPPKNALLHISGQYTRMRMTARRLQVLKMVATGAKQDYIARKLGISVRTVEKHRRVVYAVTGAECPAELAHWALRHGIVENMYA